MEIYNRIKNGGPTVDIINELIDSAIYCDILNRYESLHHELYAFCLQNLIYLYFSIIMMLNILHFLRCNGLFNRHN